jgi:bifunctional DNA-binding transcriptional regulator/antitoxin component of YhaV-PrlF toxin-antitoxin module
MAGSSRLTIQELDMYLATLNKRAQITVPNEVRQALQLKAGDRILFVQKAPECFELVAVNRSITEMKGMFGKSIKTVSIAAMNPAKWAGKRSTRVD